MAWLSVVKRGWARVVDFVSVREDAASLALCRIVVCLAVATHSARFALSGASEWGLLHATRGGMGMRHGWLEYVGGAVPPWPTLLPLLCALFGTMGLVGLFTRPVLVVTWLLYRTMSTITPEARGAYDPLIIDILFVLLLSGCGRALSLDAIIFKRDRLVARWPRIMLVLQMGLLYFGSAVHKASSGWVPGGDASALWFILQQSMWARFPDALPLWTYPLTQIATTLVWLFELFGMLIVVAVVARERERGGLVKRALDRVRFLELYLVFGVAMHVGIEISMEVGAFTLASLALYPACVRPDRWTRFTRRIRGQDGSRPSQSADERMGLQP